MTETTEDAADEAGSTLEDVAAAVDSQSILLEKIHQAVSALSSEEGDGRRQDNAGGDPAAGTAPLENVQKELLEVMKALDAQTKMLEKIQQNAPGRAPSSESVAAPGISEADREIGKSVRTAASDLARMVEADRGHFRRFGWVAAGIALPGMLALGLLAQQEFGILTPVDSTGGWKDIVWRSYGPEIADCLTRERVTGGDCIVAITTPGE